MPRTTENSLRGSSCCCCHSCTSRAELIFAVSLVEHHLREGSHSRRLSDMVPIFLVAILEFLTSRLLELASNEAQCRVTQRCITTEMLDLVVYNTLLSKLFQFITISQNIVSLSFTVDGSTAPGLLVIVNAMRLRWFLMGVLITDIIMAPSCSRTTDLNMALCGTMFYEH
ncbi:histone H2A-Bbd type 2/3-like [Mastomys coucha]|uniref:histone H2A-Bbd type 2/3-like n=1 Tax=Mastomys coucha TaxID=35658 RepID=UPI00126217C6|nr:histone H2A-Bbd type 2/3-like [Mastomys coucha]